MRIPLIEIVIIALLQMAIGMVARVKSVKLDLSIPSAKRNIDGYKTIVKRAEQLWQMADLLTYIAIAEIVLPIFTNCYWLLINY